MAKIVTVEQCIYCPYCVSLSSGRICSHPQLPNTELSMKDTGSSIPEWCPLPTIPEPITPDAPEVEEGR